MKLAPRIDRLIDKPDSKVRAIASVSFDGVFAVHGIRVVEGKNGLTATMPSNKYEGKNGETKYSDIFHAITKEGYEALNRSVLNAYQFKLQQSQQTDVEIVPASEHNEENAPDEFSEGDIPPDHAQDDIGETF